MMLPGPEAQQLAIYIGWLMHRTWGGIVAGAFFVIPSILILLALSYVYAAYGNVPAVAGVLAGFKPVVVAIVVEAVIKIRGQGAQAAGSLRAGGRRLRRALQIQGGRVVGRHRRGGTRADVR
jgi:chromate transporter